jgi:hypothetical protein
MIDTQAISDKMKILNDDKQSEIIDFIDFPVEQEKKSLLLTQLNTTFVKEWLSEPSEEIYND